MKVGLIRKLWRCLPGLWAAGLTAGLMSLNPLTSLENASYRWLFQLRGEIPWDERLVLVKIDDATIDALGRFPFSRQVYTQLLERLEPANPSVIGFNILFTEPSREDRAFAQAMVRHNRIVFAVGLDEQERWLLPTEQFADVTIATGHIMNPISSDGLVHAVEPLIDTQLALGLAMAESYSLTNARVTVPPLDQPLWLNWPGSLQAIPQYALIDVLNGDALKPQSLEGKVVLVGVTATGIDSIPTPFDNNPTGSGLLVHAAVLDNILQERYLKPLDHPWLWSILLVGMPVLSYGLIGQTLRWQLLFILGSTTAWLLISLVLFHSAYLLPTLMPMLLLGLTGALSIVGQRLRENLALRQLLRQLWQYPQQTSTMRPNLNNSSGS